MYACVMYVCAHKSDMCVYIYMCVRVCDESTLVCVWGEHVCACGVSTCVHVTVGWHINP